MPEFVPLPINTLPGYVDLPLDAAAYTRQGQVMCARIVGPFLVRGQNSVDSISDGWLCRGEDGYLFGVEDAVFSSLFAIVEG
jgi:hypothetical protein